MKLGLISAVDKDSEVQNIYPSLSLGYLAAFLEKYLNFHNIIIESDANKLIVEKPDIVGITSVSQNFGRAIQIASQIKSAINVPVIIGGVHITALPHVLPECFDVGVIGEGEETLFELVKAFKQSSFYDSLKCINGVVFSENKKSIVTSPRRLIEPLDKIPFPKREFSKISTEKRAYILTSRGCLFRCKFCSSAMHWQKIRYFSPNYVVDEIEQLVEKYKVTNIQIYDDLFIGDKNRVERIAEMILKRKINKKVTFNCSVRANLLNNDICRLLRDMNVKIVNFGAESGSDRMIRYLKDNTISVEDNQRAIELCNKNGLSVTCSFIVGTPGESEMDILKTYEFIWKNRKKLLNVYIYALVPFPGTKIWEFAYKEGLVDDKMDWQKLEVDYEKILINNYIYLNKDMNKENFYSYFFRFQELHENYEHFNRIQEQFCEQGKSLNYRKIVKKLFSFPIRFKK